MCRLLPQVQVIKPGEVNETWQKVINKQARYRYVIDMASLQA